MLLPSICCLLPSTGNDVKVCPSDIFIIRSSMGGSFFEPGVNRVLCFTGSGQIEISPEDDVPAFFLLKEKSLLGDHWTFSCLALSCYHKHLKQQSNFCFHDPCSLKPPKASIGVRMLSRRRGTFQCPCSHTPTGSSSCTPFPQVEFSSLNLEVKEMDVTGT